MTQLALARGVLRSKFLGVPFSANFKVTERCNLRCPICSIWRRGNRSTELTLPEIVEGARKLRLLGLTRLVITGGEPMVRQDLTAIVEACANQGLSVTLLTNGLLGRDIVIRDLFAAGLDNMGLSLDYLTPAMQDAFYAHPGAWKKIVAMTESALKWNKRGYVYLMPTINDENISQMLPLFWTVEGWGAFFVLNIVMGSAESEPERVFSGGVTPPHYSEDQLRAIEILYDEMIRLKRRGHRILSSERFLRESVHILRTRDRRWSCHAGLRYFNIFSDGGVAPCNEYHPLINLKSPDFVEQFRGEAFQKAAASIRQQCSGCSFSCWREVSHLVTDNGVLLEQALSVLKQALR